MELTQKLIINKIDVNNTYKASFLIPNWKVIRVFNDSFTQIKLMKHYARSVTCLLQLNSKLIASGGNDCTILIWDIESGKCVNALQGHTWRVYSLAQFPQNGYIASGSGDRTIKIWDRKFDCIKTLEGHNDDIRGLKTLHNGLLVSGSGDRQIKIWNPDDNYSCIFTIKGHEKEVRSILQLSNEILISVSIDQYIKIWNFSENKLNIANSVDTGSACYCLCIISQNRIATGHEDQIIRIWDSSTLECMGKLEGHTNSLMALKILKGGSLVSAGCMSEVIIWKPSNDSNLYKEWKRISNEGGTFNSMIELYH